MPSRRHRLQQRSCRIDNDVSSAVTDGLRPHHSAVSAPACHSVLFAITTGNVIGNRFCPFLVPGGFIGVDVFFDISGFLVIAHMFANLTNTGSISFRV